MMRCTSVDHIYAIGDVTAKLQLAHVAEAQGVVAAEVIAGEETQLLGDYQMMPRATFCSPQVASFGYTEEAAKKKAEEEGREIKVATFPYTANGNPGLQPCGWLREVGGRCRVRRAAGWPHGYRMSPSCCQS